MKKFVLTFLLLFASNLIFSQIVWYGKAGGGFARIIDLDSEFEVTWKPTYSIGVGARYALNNVISLKSELSYLNNGYRTKLAPENYDFHFHNAGILVGLGVPASSRFEIETGMRYSYSFYIRDAYNRDWAGLFQRGDLATFFGINFRLANKIVLNPRFQYGLSTAIDETNVLVTGQYGNPKSIDLPKDPKHHIQALLYLDYSF